MTVAKGSSFIPSIGGWPKGVFEVVKVSIHLFLQDATHIKKL